MSVVFIGLVNIQFTIVLVVVSVLTSEKSVLEKLVVTQSVTKSLAFFGTRSSITVFTTIRHWNLS